MSITERDAHSATWQQFSRGEEEAVSELYRQHYFALINYGLTLISDRGKVNDHFMEVLLGLWDKRSRLPEVMNVRSYLMTSLRRKILDGIKTENRHKIIHQELEEELETTQWSYEDYLVKYYSDKEFRTRIESALKKLSPRQLELLQMKFYRDMDYATIATECRITKRTAYNIIYDAIKILKVELYDDKNSSFQIHIPGIILFLLTAAGSKNIL
jgi:RNA polymerase sigma factor (sigma-70 family)